MWKNQKFTIHGFQGAGWDPPEMILSDPFIGVTYNTQNLVSSQLIRVKYVTTVKKYYKADISTFKQWYSQTSILQTCGDLAEWSG